MLTIAVTLFLTAGAGALFLVSEVSKRTHVEQLADEVEMQAADADSDVLEYADLLHFLGALPDEVFFELEKRDEQRNKV